ncbi:potassium channel family protein [Hugenholtzia roseola]|uniref:potassium channel family protein n=1 Tax=Hugenholtzia roseola TaxID=1002 RepID=UPI0003F84B9C|nr:potassium channel family protein [Hugenholtzia roseola]
MNPKLQYWEERVFNIVEKHEKGNLPSLIFDVFIIILVILSVVETVIESYKDIESSYKIYLLSFEYFTIYVFSVEYLLRLFSAPAKYKYKHRGIAYLRYVFSPLAIIDLLAILPFFLPMLGWGDLRLLRLLRVLRIVRLLKLKRYSRSLGLVGQVIAEKRDELLTTLLLAQILLIIAATLMYYIEGEENPHFPNIINTLWWAVVTMTTVGYGDVVPITGLGKLLNGVIAFLGIGIVALPTSILSAGFLEKLQEAKKLRKRHTHKNAYPYDYCPHCGKKLPHE